MSSLRDLQNAPVYRQSAGRKTRMKRYRWRDGFASLNRSRLTIRVLLSPPSPSHRLTEPTLQRLRREKDLGSFTSINGS